MLRCGNGGVRLACELVNPVIVRPIVKNDSLVAVRVINVLETAERTTERIQMSSARLWSLRQRIKSGHASTVLS